LDVVAVNDLTDATTLAHLLRYDSVFGRFAGEVSVEADAIIVNGKRIRVIAEKDPAKLPWKLSAEQAAERGGEKVELDLLLRRADFVLVCCALTPETEAMLGRAEFAQMKHNLRHSARQKHAHGGMMLWTVRQNIDDARNFTIDLDPIIHRGPAQSSRMRNGGHVQKQIRRTAHGRVDGHRVANALICDEVAHPQPFRFKIADGSRGSHRHVRPHRLAGGR
jgi:hypothetical protein